MTELGEDQKIFPGVKYEFYEAYWINDIMKNTAKDLEYQSAQGTFILIDTRLTTHKDLTGHSLSPNAPSVIVLLYQSTLYFANSGFPQSQIVLLFN